MSVYKRLKARTIEKDGCWEWTLHRNHSGYGLTHIGGKTRYAHRLMWEEVNGKIPEGMYVCHKCDNPSCINPDHLFLGTQLENMQDMVRKGRSARGDKHKSHLHPESVPRGDQHYSHTNPEKVPKGDRNGSRTHPECRPRGEKIKTSKLTEIDVRYIRTNPDNLTLDALRRLFGVNRNTIWAAKTGRTWKEIK